MSNAFLILIAVFVGASLLRLPVAFSMLAAGFAYLLAGGKDMALAAEQIMTSLQQSYVLLAVPMFILAANVMNAGTISERHWCAANAMVPMVENFTTRTIRRLPSSASIASKSF